MISKFPTHVLNARAVDYAIFGRNESSYAPSKFPGFVTPRSIVQPRFPFPSTVTKNELDEALFPYALEVSNSARRYLFSAVMPLLLELGYNSNASSITQRFMRLAPSDRKLKKGEHINVFEVVNSSHRVFTELRTKHLTFEFSCYLHVGATEAFHQYNLYDPVTEAISRMFNHKERYCGNRDLQLMLYTADASRNASRSRDCMDFDSVACELDKMQKLVTGMRERRLALLRELLDKPAHSVTMHGGIEHVVAPTPNTERELVGSFSLTITHNKQKAKP